MDPNMNQNDQMNVQPQMMNTQEISQAQVLNYEDVNYTAEAETKSSSLKKGALFFALIGIILLGGGIFYKLTPSDEPTPAPSDTKAISTESGANTCTLSDNGGNDSLIRTATYTLNYDDNRALIGYTKEYNASTIAENVQSGVSFNNELTAFQTIVTETNATPIPGYVLSLVEQPETDGVKSMNVKVVIDLAILEAPKLTKNITSNSVAQVDLTKGTSEADILSKLTSYGYTCQ